jgi:hypothetical protein
MPIAKDGPATGAGFALRLRPSTFGIFDEFPDDAGRNAHRSGQVAKTADVGKQLQFARPPAIGKPDALAAKPPGNSG